MIAYSPEAESARAYLLKSYNDIDVFVEDVTCQNMYIRLINRMLGGRARITQVFPLGSRRNVIEKCRDDQRQRARRRLYIVDGDMDLLLGRPVPRLRNLYRLKVYCSENLLLSEHALVTLATEGKPNASWPEMAVQMGIAPLLKDAVQRLLPLFIVYAVIAELGLGIETVGFTVHRLLEDSTNPFTLSDNRIRSRIFSLLREIRSNVSPRRYRSVRNVILRRLAKSKRDPSVYISGKTYLLPLAYLQLKRIAGLNDSADRIKVRLAQHCELTIDKGLRNALRSSVLPVKVSSAACPRRRHGASVRD